MYYVDTSGNPCLQGTAPMGGERERESAQAREGEEP